MLLGVKPDFFEWLVPLGGRGPSGIAVHAVRGGRQRDAPRWGDILARRGAARSDFQDSREGFSAWVPGLPGCWAQAATEVEEAVPDAKGAIKGHRAAVEALRRGAAIRTVDVAP
jgi:hypothetical protein